MNLGNYKQAEQEFLIFAYPMATNREMDREERKYLKNLFLQEKEVRYKEIQKLLELNNLPTDFSKSENLVILEKWAEANMEDNGVPRQNLELNKQILVENYIFHKNTPLVEEYMASDLWFSILLDIGIKIGEDKIEQYPHLKWKMQTHAPTMDGYNNMCISGFRHGPTKNHVVSVLEGTTSIWPYMVKYRMPGKYHFQLTVNEIDRYA